MEQQVVWIVAVLTLITLVGVLWRMKGGFGPFNLRAIGIVVLAAFAVLLALTKQNALTASIGLLGAIAGYLFSYKEKESSSNIGVESSRFGDNARIAGRDVNETIEQLHADIADLRNAAIYQSQILQSSRGSSPLTSLPTGMDYYIITIFERGEAIRDAVENTIHAIEPDGWRLAALTSDYKGMDGIMLLFSRLRRSETLVVNYHHGSLKKTG